MANNQSIKLLERQQQISSILIRCLLTALLFQACQSATTDNPASDQAPEGTPVTVGPVEHGNLSDTLFLNATAAYLVKLPLKANTTGYIRKVNAKPGDIVQNGQTIFSIETKEAKALGNMVNRLDSSFHFSGIVAVRAPATGQINDFNIESNSYVQEGDILATISDKNSFSFVLNVPYEWQSFLSPGTIVSISLPDGRVTSAVAAQRFVQMDSVSQTERIALHPRENLNAPEGLIAKVTLLKDLHTNACYVPRNAVLSNEMQTEFWVMKVMDSTLAVKVNVQKGMETNGSIEIISPAFRNSDRVIVSGAYGLADTARISIHN